MIRVFYAFGKSYFNKISDLSLFNNASDVFSSDDFVCPKCGRKQDASFIQSYPRYLITIEKGQIVTHIISVKQVRCDSCDSIHAILPDCLVPYSSYSLAFILKVLRSYFFRSCSVEVLCANYLIAVSTLYSWIKLFHLHKRLWLGLLNNLQISSTDFLDTLLSSDFPSDTFVSSTGFSFMQGAFTTPFNSS